MDTHHSAIGLHIGMLGVGVLGVDSHHHLSTSLMPVMTTRHLLFVLGREEECGLRTEVSGDKQNFCDNVSQLLECQ